MLHKQLTHKIRASSAQVIVNSSVRLCQTPDNFNVNLNCVRQTAFSWRKNMV